MTDRPQQESEERFSDWLKRGAQPAWDQAVSHRFTKELANDSLDDAVYRHYLIQDYVFLDRLVRLIALTIARAPEMPAQSKLAGFLAAVTGEENTYFLRSFEALGVDEATWQGAEAKAVTTELGDLMLGTASKGPAEGGGFAACLAVLLPAEWIYLSWAQQAAATGPRPQRFYLSEWIDLHVDPAFEAFVTWLREEMDRQGDAATPAERRALAQLFLRVTELEVAFFDAAYG